jgi:hypothetical protein
MKIPAPEFHMPCLWSDDGGRTFHPIAAPSGISRPWAGFWRVLSNGWVLFAEEVTGRTLWLTRFIGKDWTPCPLPDGLIVWNASVGEDEKVYLACEVRDLQGAGDDRQGIIAVLGKDGLEFLSPPFDGRDIRKLRNHGGDQAFERIDATEHPIVVTSDCYTCIDAFVLSDFASDTFILTEDQPNWSVLRLNTQGMHIVREPLRSVAIYTYDGRRFMRSLLDNMWQEDNIMPAVEQWTKDEPNAKPELTVVSVREDALIVGVTLYPSDDTDGPALGSYILRSDDKGKSFDVLMSKRGDVEVCGILNAD